MGKIDCRQIRGAIALHRVETRKAIAAQKDTATYGVGSTRTSRRGSGSMYAVYLRGLAYLKLQQGHQAAAEFQEMLDHPEVVGNFVIEALTHRIRDTPKEA